MYSFDVDLSIPLVFCPSYSIFFVFTGLFCFPECVCDTFLRCVCSASMSFFFYLPCFPVREYHNSLMSSSLLQILAGVFGLIESPLDPKVVLVLFVCASVCVCSMARDEMAIKHKGSRDALREVCHFAPQPCRLHTRGLIREARAAYQPPRPPPIHLFLLNGSGVRKTRERTEVEEPQTSAPGPLISMTATLVHTP